MVDNPSMSKLKVRLLGVRATRKRVAEKPEFARHGLSDLDVIIRSAEAKGRAAARRGSAFQSDGSNMMAVVVVVVVVGGAPQESRGYSARVRRRQSAKPAGERRSERSRGVEYTGSRGRDVNECWSNDGVVVEERSVLLRRLETGKCSSGLAALSGRAAKEW
jgi:hypothetical protein